MAPRTIESMGPFAAGKADVLTAMFALLTIILLAGLIFSANFISVRLPSTGSRRWAFALMALNVPFLLIGAGLTLAPLSLLAPLLTDPSQDSALLRGDGITMLLTGAAGFLCTLGPVRRLAGRLTRLQPDQPVHMTALMLAGYLVGSSGASLVQGGLLDLTERVQPATLADIGLNYLLFVVLALTGTGLFTRRSLRELGDRLGLLAPTARHLSLAMALILPLLILQALIGGAWAYWNPDQAALLEGLNGVLYAEFDTVLEWLLLALATGVAEEMLFRGALQPIFGLWVTAILFAISHTQYALTPATLAVFLLALILGHIRQRTNTTTAILVHAGYNFAIGLLSLAAASLT